MYKDKVDHKTTMYNYQKDGKICSTPNVEIAITRRDDSADIQVETREGGEVKLSTLVIG